MLNVSGVQIGSRPPISFAVARGEVVAVIGRNGSGKSALLRGIAGEARVTAGEVSVDGVTVSRRPVHKRVAAGLVFVSEDRDVFGALTVDDHLRLFRADETKRRAVFEVFPRLAELSRQRASTLSGGEQQMLAMARAVIDEPKVLLTDEPGAGLSPKLVADLYAAIAGAAQRGAAVVVAEQHIERARAVAATLVVLGDGGAAYLGPPAGLSDDVVTAVFLGRSP
jgi:branched-chain amino acid transport system ATP-binding protein